MKMNRSVALLLLIVVVEAGKPSVSFKMMRSEDYPLVSRDLQNEALTDGESQKWLGALHWKESNPRVLGHMRCDACYEMKEELRKQLSTFRTLPENKMRDEVKKLHVGGFCSKMQYKLRLLLDEDNIALPKFGFGKKTCVHGGWPQEFVFNYCSAIMGRYKTADIVEAVHLLEDPDKYPKNDIFEMCEKYSRCRPHDASTRLKIAQEMKAANYSSSVHGCGPHVPEVPRAIQDRLDKMAEGLQAQYDTKEVVSSSDLLQWDMEKRIAELRRKELQKDMNAASSRIRWELEAHRRRREQFEKEYEGKKKPKYYFDFGASAEERTSNQEE